MKRWIHLLCALAASTILSGQDCFVSTEFRRLMASVPELAEERLDEKTGRYAAVMKNGDQLLARFEPCELGLRVHYLLPRKLSAEDRLKTIRWLLTRILPSKAVADHVLPQLDTYASSEFRDPVLLKGVNDAHKVVVRTPRSPLFQSEIYYEWIPPEH